MPRGRLFLCFFLGLDLLLLLHHWRRLRTCARGDGCRVLVRQARLDLRHLHQSRARLVVGDGAGHQQARPRATPIVFRLAGHKPPPFVAYLTNVGGAESFRKLCNREPWNSREPPRRGKSALIAAKERRESAIRLLSLRACAGLAPPMHACALLPLPHRRKAHSNDRSSVAMASQVSPSRRAATRSAARTLAQLPMSSMQ